MFEREEESSLGAGRRARSVPSMLHVTKPKVMRTGRWVCLTASGVSPDVHFFGGVIISSDTASGSAAEITIVSPIFSFSRTVTSFTGTVT